MYAYHSQFHAGSIKLHTFHFLLIKPWKFFDFIAKNDTCITKPHEIKKVIAI